MIQYNDDRAYQERYDDEAEQVLSEDDEEQRLQDLADHDEQDQALRDELESSEDAVDHNEERERSRHGYDPTVRETDFTWLDDTLHAAQKRARQRALEDAYQQYISEEAEFAHWREQSRLSEQPTSRTLEDVLRDISEMEPDYTRAKLLNLFSEAGRQKAEDGLKSADPIERELSKKFLRDRIKAKSTYCNYPACGKPLERHTGRGRPARYCDGHRTPGFRWEAKDKANPIDDRRKVWESTRKAPITNIRTSPWRSAWSLALREYGLSLVDLEREGVTVELLQQVGVNPWSEDTNTATMLEILRVLQRRKKAG